MFTNRVPHNYKTHNNSPQYFLSLIHIYTQCRVLKLNAIKSSRVSCITLLGILLLFTYSELGRISLCEDGVSGNME